MRNIFIETIERITGKKVIEEKMSCIHDGKTPLDELVDLAYRTKESFDADIKIGKPGKKLTGVHTGMLDADRKLIKKEIKKEVKEKKKLLKKSRKKETPSETLRRLEREISELEKRV